VDFVLDTALAGILGLAAERVCGREVQPAGLSVLAAAAVRIRRIGPRAAVGVDASYCPGDTSRDPRVCSAENRSMNRSSRVARLGVSPDATLEHHSCHGIDVAGQDRTAPRRSGTTSGFYHRRSKRRCAKLTARTPRRSGHPHRCVAFHADLARAAWWPRAQAETARTIQILMRISAALPPRGPRIAL
jgi:hypothetical protein